jgi:hypothetical protein
MREGNNYFDGGKVILCMNNIFQMPEERKRIYGEILKRVLTITKRIKEN